MIAAAVTFRDALEASLGALPRAGLIPSPHLGTVSGVSLIATALGITSIVMTAQFAIRRGQFHPRPSRVIPAGTVA